jgi:phage shock protein A
VSAADKAFSLVKRIMLYDETIASLRKDLADLTTDVIKLAESHARLSERVADIEGYLRAATRTPFGEPLKLDNK